MKNISYFLRQVITVLPIAFFVVMLSRFLFVVIKNGKTPGSVDPVTIELRKTMLFVTSAVFGLIALIIKALRVLFS